MFTTSQRTSGGTNNFNQVLAHEARLNRIHRLFKTHINVTEPSLVLEPYLFLGNCISAHDIHRLSRLGIRYVLNVAKRDVEVCPYYPNEMRTLTIDLRDDDRENILRTFDQAFAFIDEARRAKSRVLVHCSHGQSRSPAIVIAYLMRSYNVPLEQCLTHVVKARPCIIPNDGFLKQLILYDRILVERRRKQQEEAVMQVLKAATGTEIPIQHHPPMGPQPAQAPATTAVPSAERPPASVPTTTNISSVDSSSIGLTSTSTSSIQSSVSDSSIQVIPIQIASKESTPEKIDIIPIESKSTSDENLLKSSSKTSSKKKEKTNGEKSSKSSSKTQLENCSSQKSLRSKQRSSMKKTKEQPKQLSPEVSRSTTGNFDRSHVTQPYHPSFDLTPQQWDFINNYPSNYGLSNEYVKTNYITEIYDRATNRFIPTTCY